MDYLEVRKVRKPQVPRAFQVNLGAVAAVPAAAVAVRRLLQL